MDAERQRRLHVENRLEELRAKHGTAVEEVPMPAWLDSLEGALQRSAVDQPQPVAPMRRSPSADSRVVVAVPEKPVVDSGPLEEHALMDQLEL